MDAIGAKIIAKAESFPGIKAGIASFDDILKAPSYQAVPDGRWNPFLTNGEIATEWPPNAKSVVVLGLHHPEDNPQLDWWHDGNTDGNRQLMQVSSFLKQWLHETLGLNAVPLPYHVERGGIFLKDAAILAGLGVLGKSNLVLNPTFGPRIRFRSILIDRELEPGGPIEGFSPCDSCAEMCRSACPQDAFASGSYHRPNCIVQINADIANKTPDVKIGEDGNSRQVIKFCRACELACPVGLIDDFIKG